MVRAAVLIGVRGNGEAFTRLQAVDASLSAMKDWLRSQEIDGNRLIVISDEDKPVTLTDIKDAVAGLLKDGTVTQLIVYFTGHGICAGSVEFWLLSAAPANPDEAVNVESSIAFARRLSVPHTILISDACRSPPPDIQGQSLTGGSIFPNLPPPRAESSVDVYFGCALGTPSLEVKSIQDVGAGFQSIFTGAFVDAVMGHVPPLLEAEPASPGFKVVRGWPLKEHLSLEVTRRIIERNLPLQVNQTPDARITSPPHAWVSLLPEVESGEAEDIVPHVAYEHLAFSLGPPLPEALGAASSRLIREAVLPPKATGGWLGLGRVRSRIVETPDNPGLKRAIEAARKRQEEAEHARPRVGLSVHGANHYQVFDMQGREISKESMSHWTSPASVVLVLDSTAFVVVPVIPDKRTDVFWRDASLVDIRVESGRRGSTLRHLESIIEGAGTLASFNPRTPDLISLASREPLSVAAEVQLNYAMYDQGIASELGERIRRFRAKYGFELPDTVMLAQELLAPGSSEVLLGYPLLSRGWALVEAFVASPPRSWRILQRHLRDGIWSSYHTGALESLF